MDIIFSLTYFSYFYPLYNPTEKITNNACFITSNGTNILIKVPNTINGPNGIYSSIFFDFRC